MALWVSSGTSFGQDQQFTQFNAAPTSFNPAYAGVSGQARLATLYRAQWTGLPQAFTAFHMAYDRPTLDKKMGFGFLMSNEQAGAGAVNRFQFMGCRPAGGWGVAPTCERHEGFEDGAST